MNNCIYGICIWCDGYIQRVSKALDDEWLSCTNTSVELYMWYDGYIQTVSI